MHSSLVLKLCAIMQSNIKIKIENTTSHLVAFKNFCDLGSKPHITTFIFCQTWLIDNGFQNTERRSCIKATSKLPFRKLLNFFGEVFQITSAAIYLLYKKPETIDTNTTQFSVNESSIHSVRTKYTIVPTSYPQFILQSASLLLMQCLCLNIRF